MVYHVYYADKILDGYCPDYKMLRVRFDGKPGAWNTARAAEKYAGRYFQPGFWITRRCNDCSNGLHS